MSEKKQPVDLGLLEEDDEFEEFPAEDWAGLDEDEDAHVWEDNWDDDNVEDDFSNQLRKHEEDEYCNFQFPGFEEIKEAFWLNLAKEGVESEACADLLI
ncbi:26S proteasome complex subunit SEM1 isoform X1 [Vicugna pacos]|uniref:26S proteasome complex subunit SEM1 n=1 Tax=Vicugna pacos TaxID=30538 RepID=A0ABM5DJI3_VICPA